MQSSINNFKHQPLLWGLLHGLNDFVAGYMLANFTYKHQYKDAVTMLVIYAIIGFGGQLPVGFWLDKQKQIKPFATFSILILLLAIGCYFLDPFIAIILSGVAGAGIHVTGGAVCLQVNENKSGPLALFTAPGVLGLTLGGFLGNISTIYLIIPAIAIVLLAIKIFYYGLPFYQAQNKNTASQLDAHDFIMLGILLIMCFRSFIYDVINNVALNYQHGILIIGISAFAGKIIGGYLADFIGWKKFVYITLPLSFLLFQFGKENIYALAFGIACLQSSVPLTLLLMSQSLPLYPATATALSLGTSIAFAGLPLYMVSDSYNFTSWFKTNPFWVILFISMLALWLVIILIKKRFYKASLT
jgi:FSR family fosmidomycin resistance protein-like MFS transporter